MDNKSLNLSLQVFKLVYLCYRLNHMRLMGSSKLRDDLSILKYYS